MPAFSNQKIFSDCFIGWMILLDGASSGDQVEDQYDGREHQKKVDHASCNVKAESQHPEYQDNYKNRPKHI
jgi:hypothetical protein